jgi:hypothetical protein
VFRRTGVFSKVLNFVFPDNREDYDQWLWMEYNLFNSIDLYELKLHWCKVRAKSQYSLPDSLFQQRRAHRKSGEKWKLEIRDHSKRLRTQLFVNKYSVEKALRFNGRVLDKEPIKIKKHPTHTSTITSNSVSAQSMQLRSHSLIERFELPPVHSLASKLWHTVVQEVRLIECS